MKVGDVVQWDESTPYAKNRAKYYDFVVEGAYYTVVGLQNSGILLNIPNDPHPQNEWDRGYWKLVPKEFFVKAFIHERL